MRLSYIAAALASAIALCEGSSKMVIGYLPNWLNADYPVESIPFNKYTHINYAFAILNNEDNLPSFPDDWAVESSLPKIVDMAHASNTKVLLSVGGWTGSKRFSPMVATATSRQKFIEWSKAFIDKYKLDGIDLDWEYPGQQAAGCNEFADNDADNLLLLLKELREALDTAYPSNHKEISMAVYVKPFIKSGIPMTSVKEFVPYFDHINLMTYDMNGAWASTTGPNAPFRVEEGKGSPFSFVGSIRDWKAAGVPANKITAGLAFYGRSMKAQVDMTIQRNQFQSSEVGAPKGDAEDAYWEDPYCKAEAGGFSGIWKWSSLRNEGILKADLVTPGDGWQRNWDDVTQTPWLFNPSTKHFITYDDPRSLTIKVEHAYCEDLAGVMVWDIHQDNGELVDVINKIHTVSPAVCNSSEAAEDDKKVAAPVADTSAEDPDFNDADWEDEFWLGDTTTTTEPTTKPTSDKVLSPPTDVKEYDGTACSNNGQEKCASIGKSSTWLTCNFDKWIARDCAPGLVCNERQGAVFCDFPSELNAVAAAAAVPESNVNAIALPIQDDSFEEVENMIIADPISAEAIEEEAISISFPGFSFSFSFPPFSFPDIIISTPPLFGSSSASPAPTNTESSPSVSAPSVIDILSQSSSDSASVIHFEPSAVLDHLPHVSLSSSIPEASPIPSSFPAALDILSQVAPSSPTSDISLESNDPFITSY